LNFASSKGGTLGTPTIGEFKNGRGEFFDQEDFNGRPVLVRFIISDIKPNPAGSSNRSQQTAAKPGK
jgi:hypothetical protein